LYLKNGRGGSLALYNLEGRRLWSRDIRLALPIFRFRLIFAGASVGDMERTGSLTAYGSTIEKLSDLPKEKILG
jgi:hypothetical protein